MDAESIKQLTTDINNVVDAHTKPLHVKIESLVKQLDDAWKELNGVKNENKRLKIFVQRVANTGATGGDPEYECELCRGELQYSAKRVLKGE